MRGLTITWTAILTLAALGISRQSVADERAAAAEAAMVQGEAAFGALDYDEALKHFSTARDLAPDRPGPYLRLGIVHATAGHCAAAIPFLEEYLRLKPKDARPEARRTLDDCRSRTSAPPMASAPPTPPAKSIAPAVDPAPVPVPVMEKAAPTRITVVPHPKKKPPYWVAGVVIGAAAVVGIVVGIAVGVSTPDDATIPPNDGSAMVKF